MTERNDTRGLYPRYKVEKQDGSTDPNARYFVLRLDYGGSDIFHVRACQEAALLYARVIRDRLPVLAHDLEKLVAEERAKQAYNEVVCHQIVDQQQEIRRLNRQVEALKSERDKLVAQK